MSGYFLFTTIFQITLVKNSPSKIIRDHVKIDFFSGPRSFKIPIQNNVIARKGTDTPVAEDTIIAQEALLNLHSGSRYIMITARTKENNPIIARKFCENEIDRTITDLSLIYGCGLLAKNIYRGWLIDQNVIMDAWLSIQEPFIISKDIESILFSLNKKQRIDDDINQRYSTMSRFLSKAILVQPSEEKLLYLWTILEIFPMKNTSHIKSIGEFLSSRLNRPIAEVNEKLAIGRMNGVRSALVHDGKLTIEISELGNFFERLENICLEVLRGMNGIAYNGGLDKYFI